MNENLPVAIQVYGLRDLLEETPERFEEVMCSVKEMGYQGVELAGLYGLEPGEVKRILDIPHAERPYDRGTAEEKYPEQRKSAA